MMPNRDTFLLLNAALVIVRSLEESSYGSGITFSTGLRQQISDLRKGLEERIYPGQPPSAYLKP